MRQKDRYRRTERQMDKDRQTIYCISDRQKADIDKQTISETNRHTDDR